MLTLLRVANVVLLVSIVGCILGTLAGLIVFVPFLGGAWVLNAMALAGYEDEARPGWIERLHSQQVAEPADQPEPFHRFVSAAQQPGKASAVSVKSAVGGAAHPQENKETST